VGLIMTKPFIDIRQYRGPKYHDLLRFWANRFLSTECSWTVARRLKLWIEVRSTGIEKGANGHVCRTGEKHTYLIRIHSYLTGPAQVSTLFHELAHVLQFEAGHLKHSSLLKKIPGFWWGRGRKKEFFASNALASTEEYNELPWEQEANCAQVIWNQEFCAHMGPVLEQWVREQGT
jgi:hypothetical protein